MSGGGLSGLPSSIGRVLTLRAALGALLVTVALLGVTQAYAHADRPPSTGYAVAARALDPGTRLELTALELVPVDLPAALAARAFRALDVLDGAVTLAPLAPGELILLSQVLPADAVAAHGVDLSFAISADRALGGAVRPGEEVDLVATSPGGGAGAGVVARRALVTHAAAAGDALLDDRSDLVLTVRVRQESELLAVVDAVDDGQLTVVRPAVGPPP